MLEALAALLSGYLLGALPFGAIAGRLTHGIDLTSYGSGRTGATNALRTLGPRAAAVVLVLDASKGALAVAIGAALGMILAPPNAAWLPAIGGLAAVVGHLRSIFIGMAGGRGVATSGGALLLLTPLTVAAVLPVAAGVLAATRYASLASLTAAALAPAVAIGLAWLGWGTWPAAVFAAAAALLVITAHRDNIERLRAGSERRIGERVETPT